MHAPSCHPAATYGSLMGKEFFQDKCYNLTKSCSGKEMEVQEILMVATLAVFNVCWGVMASLPVRTIILNFCVTNGSDRCLQFVIKVFRHPCSQLRPLEKVLRAPKSAQVSLRRMTKRISTSSGHHVPRPLLHILSCPHLGQQVGARISCL